MHNGLGRVGRTMRAAERKGATRFVTGVTKGAPSDGRILVEVAGQSVPAVIPGSFRAALATGQDVRLSVQGSTYTVDSVLSALPTPAVAAPPASASTSSASGGWSSVVSSGTYDAASGNAFAYARDNAATTRALAADINELRGKSNLNEDGLEALKASYNDLTTKYNSLKTSYDQLWTALKSQGLIS